MDVFVMLHAHEVDDSEEVKMVGVYSTEDAAKSAIERLRRQPGFCDTTDGFHVDRYCLDEDHWAEGFVSLPRET